MLLGKKTAPPFVSGKILLSKQNWEWIFTTLQKKKKNRMELHTQNITFSGV